MFKNKTQTYCSVKQTEGAAAWIPLRHRNQYIYSLQAPAHATVVCNKEISQTSLVGVGLLILEPNCILKHNFISIQAQHVISSSVKSSYSTLWNITEQIHKQRVQPLLDRLDRVQYLPQLKNLTKLQTSLTIQDVLQLPNKIKNQNYHHMVVGYASLTLIGCICLYLKCTRQLIVPNHVLPTPAPRNQMQTADFTVHV